MFEPNKFKHIEGIHQNKSRTQTKGITQGMHQGRIEELLNCVCG